LRFVAGPVEAVEPDGFHKVAAGKVEVASPLRHEKNLWSRLDVRLADVRKELQE
jgi:hypothetical protein